MAEMYMRNVRDWRDATMMLSLEEKGYFDELLNLIYMYDDCLPDNDEFISRAMPISVRLHRRLKDKLIKLGLITIKDGFYHNKRASKELLKINSLSTKNKLKADKRWSKSLKNNESGDAAAMLKVNSESESISQKDKKGKSHAKEQDNGKCTIDDILDPDGEIPEDYRKFAEAEGLENPQRTFERWASWWVSEAGRKAGRRGWFATWKTRVRKDVERQNAASRGQNRPGNGSGACSTTNGARLALNRRRNRKRKIQMEK